MKTLIRRSIVMSAACLLALSAGCTDSADVRDDEGAGGSSTTPPDGSGAEGGGDGGAGGADAVTSSSSASAGGGDPAGTGGGGEGGSGAGGEEAAGGAGGGAAWDPDAGWTALQPSPDSRVIYVSSNDGDDADDGLTQATAKRTIAAGKALLRSGQPDWLLLKRGDVWTEALGSWSKSGKDDDEPMVVGAYGEGDRPWLKTGADNGLYVWGDPVRHVAFTGIRMTAHTRVPGSPEYVGPASGLGVFWGASAEDILFEDLHIEYYGDNVAIMAHEGPIADVTFRRNVITDAYRPGRSQGIYAEGIDGLVIEENLFDHNGWSPEAGVSPTLESHNVYVHHLTRDLVFRRNVSTRASSHGLQARPGGVVEDNVFAQNGVGLSFGKVLGDSPPLPGGVTGEIAGNVILEGRDIGNQPRGMGMAIGNVLTGHVHDNVIANNGGRGFAIQLHPNGIGTNDLLVENNVIVDWGGAWATIVLEHADGVTFTANEIQATGPVRLVQAFDAVDLAEDTTWSANVFSSGHPESQWFLPGAPFDDDERTALDYVDRGRTIATYQESLGGAAGLDGFVTEAKRQRRGNYREEHTTDAVRAYLREGFTRP